MRIKNSADFLSGIMFMAIAFGFLVVGRNYDMGAAMRMGPGYSPRLICICLALLGFTVAIRGLVSVGDPVGSPAYRAGFFVLLSVLMFSLLLPWLGLFGTTLILVVTAALADPPVKLSQTFILALCLSVFAVILFAYLLKLSMPIWPVM